MNEELIDQNGETNFLEIIETEFGGWPLLNDVNSNLNLTDRLVKLRKIGYKPLIDIHVSANPKDPIESILKVCCHFFPTLNFFFLISISSR